MKVKTKITQFDSDWMSLQPFHQQSGWVLEVDDEVASRWDYITKKYCEMQSEIDTIFHNQKPDHEHFDGRPD